MTLGATHGEVVFETAVNIAEGQSLLCERRNNNRRRSGDETHILVAAHAPPFTPTGRHIMLPRITQPGVSHKVGTEAVTLETTCLANRDSPRCSSWARTMGHLEGSVKMLALMRTAGQVAPTI